MTDDTTPPPAPRGVTAEHARLAEATGAAEDDLFEANPWYEWGPYLSERAWGTVREDYSDSGDAWEYFPHDHARSRAYRWNEDGMAGLSDIHHDLCLGLALWNGADPILKERMFGLTGPQGNHGEDVKEYWWYPDALPSHAWLRWRYHYPQAAFPVSAAGRGERPPFPGRTRVRIAGYRRLRRGPVLVGGCRLREGVTDRGTCPDHHREPRTEEATLSVLPTLWFRNTWRVSGRARRRRCSWTADGIAVEHPRLSGYRLDAAPTAEGVAAAGVVLRQRDEHGPAVRVGSGHRLSEGRHQRPRGLRRGHREPATSGHQGRLVVPADRAGRGHGPSCGCGCTGRPRTDRHPARRRLVRRRTSTSVMASPGAGGRRVLRRPRPGRHRPGADAGAAAVLRGADLEQADVPVPGQPVVGRRPRPAGPAAPGIGPAGTPGGGTWTRSTCWPCPTRGSTRGSRPGIWRSTPSPGRTWIPRSPSTSCWCCCGSGSSTRTGRSRLMSGTSTTSTHRSMRWPPSGCSSSTAAPTSTSWNGCSRSCC